MALLATSTNAQDFSIQVSGFVLDIILGTPVEDQLVEIVIESGGSTISYENFTNETGFYWRDSIFVTGQGIITATTIDCLGQPHIQQGYFAPPSTSFWFDFFICTDTIPGCTAYFEHENIPGSFYDVMFFDLSQGYPQFWEWDFGDGTFSSEPSPMHHYVEPGIYPVCLTIWSNGDECYDTYCENITVENDSLDCENWFWYDTWNFVDYTFFGEAFPEPADIYLWDFGDGQEGSGQVVQHAYDPLINDFVNVELTTITIVPMGDSCWATSVQEIWVGNQGTECYNWFNYISNDNFTFQFSGFAFPEAIEYVWDFGDGQTATGLVVAHTYSDSINEFIPVTLTTYHFEPASGDSCIAISEQYIPVGFPQNCTAEFEFEADPTDFLTYVFTNNSSGLISHYFWDFGDGEYSQIQNPDHTYLGPGEYEVCLTVFNDSLGIFCMDTKCYSVEINYELIAEFTFSLDTLSGSTNIYQFYNSSEGEPDNLFWDFGDGNTSTLENPLHQYESSGQYEVCLEVNRSFQNMTVYSDDLCQDIITPEYLDFGGQVYLDGVPMNNFNGDTTVIDTGTAYLYRKYGNLIVPVDTNTFYQYGYYWFTDVREGKYIVKAGLTENSQNYENFVTSYHLNTINWTQASEIILYDSNTFDISVDLRPVQTLGQGPGNISGSIIINGSNLKAEIAVTDVLVLLLNENLEPLSFFHSDLNDQFIFENIPLGNYFLYAEATGLFTVPVTVNLNESNPSVEIELELFEEAVGIPERPVVTFEIGNIYPNPVKADIFIDLFARAEMVLNTSVYSISGQKMKEIKNLINPGKQTIEINIPDFPRGMYLLIISDNSTHEVQIRKFVK